MGWNHRGTRRGQPEDPKRPRQRGEPHGGEEPERGEDQQVAEHLDRHEVHALAHLTDEIPQRDHVHLARARTR